jgi:hypothetical protein
MANAYHHVTIANGASVSDGLDMTPYLFVALMLPGAWTAAALTFDHSIDGATWQPLYDDAGNEITIASAAVVAGRTVAIASAGPSNAFRPLRWIRLVSGTHATPVNQGAARDITVVTAN